jgi:hypothetical protein
MPKKAKKATRPPKAIEEDCIIPPALPVEALSGLVFERDDKSAEEIAAYVESQSPREKVKHAEKVISKFKLRHTTGGGYLTAEQVQTEPMNHVCQRAASFTFQTADARSARSTAASTVGA